MIKNLFVFFILSSVTLNGQFSNLAAKKQYEMGVYDLALSSYLNTESQNKLTADEMAIVADIYNKSGNTTAAIQYYAKAKAINNDVAVSPISYSKALLSVKNYEAAFDLLKNIEQSGEVKHTMAAIEYAQSMDKGQSKLDVKEFIATNKSDFAMTLVEGKPVFNTYGGLKMSERSAKAVQAQIGFSLATIDGGNNVPFIEGLANRLNIGAISFSKNGKCVFTRSVPLCEYAACRNRGASLYIADFINGAISNERGLPVNKLGVSNFDPYVSEDGKTILFASDRAGGLGGFDLYRITFDGKTWSDPINLGDKINTPGNEVSPNVSRGKLLFASDYHLGLGGYDLFESKIINGEYTEVADIPSVNGPGDETYPFLNAATGDLYFTSKRDVSSNENIYMVNLDHKEVAIKESKPAAFMLPQSESRINYGEIDGARRVSVGTVITKSNTIVYYIQLAAYNKKSVGDYDKFKNLVKFGNIYKFDAGQAVKVRLGYFVDESEARSVLMKVKKTGYPDAFVVSNSLNTSEMELVLSSFDTNTSMSSTTEKYVEASNKVTENTSSVSYKIRLASYEDPIWFDLKKVNDLGNIEQWSKGNWTIFVISGFKNFQDAEQARIKAVNRGFTSAEVVIDNGGIIETIKKN